MCSEPLRKLAENEVLDYSIPVYSVLELYDNSHTCMMGTQAVIISGYLFLYSSVREVPLSTQFQQYIAIYKWHKTLFYSSRVSRTLCIPQPIIHQVQWGGRKYNEYLNISTHYHISMRQPLVHYIYCTFHQWNTVLTYSLILFFSDCQAGSI